MLSLLLCAATVVLWIRSPRHGDQAWVVVPIRDRYWCPILWSYKHVFHVRLVGAQDRPSYGGHNP